MIDFSPETAYEDFRTVVLENSPRADMERIRRAFDFAVEAHNGQKRKDGSPYVTHAIAAATIAAQMGLDDEAIIAALLHDVLEDTSITHEELAAQFGKEVADIVEGVTKLTRVQYSTVEETQMENLRKMLLAMAKDIRVILIKLADRLHNMRTMEYQSPQKQLSKSRETMDIYAPIAHRLGVENLKNELEDLSLLYLDPIGYHEITNTLDKRREIMQHFFQEMEERIENRMAEEGIHCTVYGRLKHIYSIYRKMYAQHLGIEEIFDLCAFRVIVDDLADCYNVLGIVHEMFRPVPGRFKDYISTPKPNGYQSLHTTVIGTEGIPFEVQIRTWQMHVTAEYGVAAHWKYKSGGEGNKAGDEEKFAWIRQLLEKQQDSDAQDFYHDLKVDMFDDEVFVFTPNGDVKSLPAGATPIDFAYAIHSAVGNRMTGAKVNGRIVPISYALQNGDIVTILTSNSAAGPSRDWLAIAKSGEARSKIKQWFKKERREENIQHGITMFEAEARRMGLDMDDVRDPEMLPYILKRMAVQELDDVFASIGYGGMTAAHAAGRIRDEIARRKAPARKTELEKIQERAERRQSQEKQNRSKSVQGVLVEGLDNCLIRFSRCCTPVPGDEIIGFITRGQGVSIHRRDCSNHTRDKDAGRWIEVSWADDTNDFYTAEIRLTSDECSGFVMDIATVLNSMNARVRTLNARDTGRGTSVAKVILDVHDREELQNIMNRLQSIRGLREIVRAGS
ncbi:MAG: bifunctional (p)ppGpp synthetase/guanosine-3',5'-bis(diphosphate) 3'-pyrophosphohydrolase [Oscillospiraceae bacterium]|nr:bifunctional (p)ppGpp synthetase/guanosine-3',5'-bis(diphosphate) 3'-pyrophosphohydrolase [Oscillospiraceae bacterium]